MINKNWAMHQSIKFLLLICFLLVGSTKYSSAQTTSYNELQAIYLYNFAKYTTWPDNFTSFVVGIYDDEAIHSIVDTKLTDKKIKGHPIEVKLIENDEEVKKCHIIYISDPNSKNLTSIIESVQQQNILIVTERDLIKKGAMVSFLLLDNKLRFKINEEAIRNTQMTVSDGLLGLALK